MNIHPLDFDPRAFGRWRSMGGDFRDPVTGALAELGYDKLNNAILVRFAMKDGGAYYVDMRELVAEVITHHRKQQSAAFR